MRSLLFSGNGLVGKTTLAAATAVKSAHLGYKTLVVSGDSDRSLMDIYGCPLSTEFTDVAANLVATQLDLPNLLTQLCPQAAHHIKSLTTGENCGLSTPVDIAAIPGLNDFLTLTEVQRLAETQSWDRIVVDAGPNIDLLRICDLFAATPIVVNRIGRKGRFIFGSRWGTGIQVSNELAKRAQSLRAWLTDSDKNSVAYVLSPERAHLNTARTTLSALALHGFPVQHTLVNRLIPAPGVWPGSAAAWMKARHDDQQRLVSNLFSSDEILAIEQCATEPVGIAAITEFAADLPTELVPHKTAPRSDDHAKVVATPYGYEFHIAMPLTPQATVELSRVHDNLVVAVDGFRRIVSLPEDLRACRATKAESHARGITVSLNMPVPNMPVKNTSEDSA